MESIGNLQSRASFQDLESFAAKLSQSLQYSTDARNVCEKQLGVPKDIIENEPMSDQLKQSIKLYENVAREGDWLACVMRVNRLWSRLKGVFSLHSMHIVLLPCIMVSTSIAYGVRNKQADVLQGYYTIASKLLNDPATVRSMFSSYCWCLRV